MGIRSLITVSILAGSVFSMAAYAAANTVRVDKNSNINQVMANYGLDYKAVLKSNPSKVFSTFTGGSTHCVGYRQPITSFKGFENALKEIDVKSASLKLSCDFKNIRVMEYYNLSRQEVGNFPFYKQYEKTNSSGISTSNINRRLKLSRSGLVNYFFEKGRLKKITIKNMVSRNMVLVERIGKMTVKSMTDKF